MGRNTSEWLCGVDAGGVDHQLAFQCAPLIAGLKISHLLMIQNTRLHPLWELLKESEIRIYVLHAGEEGSVVLLYRERELADYLGREDVASFLRQCGYEKEKLPGIFRQFRGRYQRYRMAGGDFPHELGVMLGYPLEDVTGFIRNRGKNCLYAGYWKVYGHAEDKKELFRMYEQARRLLIELVGNGVRMEDILAITHEHTRE